MNAAMKDTKNTYIIEARDFDASWEQGTGGGLEGPVGDGMYLIQVDTKKDTESIRMSPWIILVHEVGGARGRTLGGFFNHHDYASIRAENSARRIVGCDRRWSHKSNWYSNCER
jgi:hypothetical protein